MPTSYRSAASSWAPTVGGTHVLEDLEIVVRQRAPVEVLEHVAAAAGAQAGALGAVARQPDGRRRQLGVVAGLEGDAAVGFGEHRTCVALEAEQDGLLHGRVLEELAGQDGGEQRPIAEVHEAGVAAR